MNNLRDIFARPRVAVMAIVNATPDSFYMASRLGSEREAIAARVEQAVEQGADILDVGGYSSRPGAQDVALEEELGRVRVAMEVIRARFPEVPVSIDTFRSSVAQAIFEEFGPVAVNDISAGELDPGMIPLVARHEVPYIAMHMRGTPADMASHTDYASFVEEIEAYFAQKIARLQQAGVHKIVIDPGFGFAKTTEQNYALLAGLPRLIALGMPLLAGLSRKSMITNVLGCDPQDALAGTCALHWQVLSAGARILRVHDVRAAADIVRLHEYYQQHGK